MFDKLCGTNFYNFQGNLWQVIEIALNAQKFSPGGVRHFNSLVDSLQNQLGDLNQDLTKSYRDDFGAISYYYHNYLNFVSSTNLYQEKIISIDKKISNSDYDSKLDSFLKDFGDYFEKSLSPCTVGGFLHGSLSTVDYTDFSDVDVGLIVKDEVLLSPGILRNLAKNLKSALKIALKFDNLQHHGFFIIPEGFLNYYPKDYLPSEVIMYSKALSKPFKLKISEYERPEYARQKLVRMAETVIKKASNPPKNLYDLKFFLSQFMLLPTLYLQAKRTYVYKKFSFDLVKKEFPKDWWVMEQVSQIRQDWIRPKSKLFDTLIDTLPNPWIPSLIYKKMDWKIPDRLLKKLTPKKYKGMRILAEKMVKSLNNAKMIEKSPI